MLGVDDVDALGAGIASFSLESDFAARYTDKYVHHDSVNVMCRAFLKKLQVLVTVQDNSDLVESVVENIFSLVVKTFRVPYTEAIDALKDDIGTLKDNIVTLKDEIASHYLSKIALMETHEKARNKAQADAYADMLKMQIQAKESAIPGSITNTEVWAAIKAHKGYRENVPLPPLPIEFQISDAEINAHFPGPYGQEPDLYPAVLGCLRKYLDCPRSESAAGAKVWPTHSTKSGFRGRRPDFTVTIDGVASSDPSSVIAPFEVKYGKAADKDFGQLYGYMKQVTQKQSRRRLFVGILYSPSGSYVLTVTRKKRDWGYDVSPMVSLAEAIGHLNYIVIPGAGYSPFFPVFSLDLGNVLARLGNPAFCAVATFQPPVPFESPPSRTRWVSSPALDDTIRNEEVVVVKRTLPATGLKQPERPVRDEIEILRRIDEVGNHRNLPQLIFHSLDFQELGILPYGTAIDPGNSMFKWPGILTDVLAALEWLHEHQIVHRDVRWDNVIYYQDRAILIDLGAAVYLDPTTVEPDSDSQNSIQSTGSPESDDDRALSAFPASGWQFYSGGLICCPQRVIGNFLDLYSPKFSDDCRAFVQMVNVLLWPRFWEGLRSELVKDKDSDLAVGLVNFWADMRKSRVWGRYVVAADNLEYGVLAEIVELCVCLGMPK